MAVANVDARRCATRVQHRRLLSETVMRHPRSLPASLVVSVSSLGVLSACDLIFGPPPAVIGDEGREGEGEEGEGEEGEGEGEGNVGEGEGEGNVGEGEGEGNVGEGEGEGVGEGEGEGNAGEGEGEGEAPAGLHAQLTWVGATADLDVRGIKEGSGGYCTTSGFFSGNGATPAPGPLASECTPAFSCSFFDCQVGDTNPPDWDASGAGRSNGDPAIDIDDTSGFGPENLTVEALDDGSYLFGAYGYTVAVPPNGSSECATLRLFIGGDLVLTRSTPILQGDWVELAEVVTVGGISSVTALEGVAGATCN